MLAPAGAEIASPAAPMERNVSATGIEVVNAAPEIDNESSMLLIRTTRRTGVMLPPRRIQRSISQPTTSTSAVMATNHGITV